MAQEDYVSFEIAKLLREKGFNENTEHEIWYVIKQFSTGCHWNSCTYKVGDITREYDDDCCIPMPTLQMTMDWLREDHHLWVDIDPLTGYKWTWSIWFMNEPDKKMGESLQSISTYKEACEAAIKYCLEHLI